MKKIVCLILLTSLLILLASCMGDQTKPTDTNADTGSTAAVTSDETDTPTGEVTTATEEITTATEEITEPSVGPKDPSDDGKWSPIV